MFIAQDPNHHLALLTHLVQIDINTEPLTLTSRLVTFVASLL
jgi:hypothetical protein